LRERESRLCRRQILNRAYGKDGERRYLTEIRADHVNMLSYKKAKDAERIVITPLEGGDSGNL
jgi:hypothetical protein